MEFQFESIDPSTGIKSASFPILTPEELEHKVAWSHETWISWRKESVTDKSKLVSLIGQSLRERKDEIAQVMQSEMGKLLKEGLAEVEKCAQFCDYMVLVAQEVLQDEIIELGNSRVIIRHDSLGILFAIMPWNFPFWQLFRATIPAILAGNTVLMKHAANTPRCAMLIEEIFEKASPRKILQNLFIDHSQAAEIIADSRVKAVTLTGSKKAGIAVANACAQVIKPVVLELGGSDPFIVFADADLQRAVDVGVASRCINNGQSCIAAKRFLVEATIFDEFVCRMKEQMGKTEIGPQATRSQQVLLDSQVQDAVAKGAKVHCGGDINLAEGFYYPPTLLTNIIPSMKVWHEEVFGPVAIVSRFDSMENALALANDTVFGLGATIFTTDTWKAQQLSHELQCGQVFINDMVRSDIRLPFGGIKESGFGRELGPKSLLAFTNEKVIWQR